MEPRRREGWRWPLSADKEAALSLLLSRSYKGAIKREEPHHHGDPEEGGATAHCVMRETHTHTLTSSSLAK